MISPVTRPKTTARRVYFPDARWYDITRWVREGIISEEKEHGKYKLVGKLVTYALTSESSTSIATSGRPN